MTICIATDSYPPHNSGIATHNSYLVKLLRESGNKIVVLTANFDQRKEEDSIEDQGDLVIVTLKKSYGQQFDYFSRIVRTGNREAAIWLSLGMAMRNWMMKNAGHYQFDLIECSDYGGFGVFLIDRMLPPVVLMCHGMLTQLNKKEFHNQDENLKIIRFLELGTLKNADAVICHSRTNAHELADEYDIRTSFVTAPWIQEKIENKKTVRYEFLTASRLQVCKGALVLAEALRSLQKDYPGIKLTWIGDDTYTAPGGWLVSKYIRKHYPTIWQKTFIWKKALPRQQMMEELNAAETLVIPSAWETFNYVALEAANRRKAAIITRQAGFASVIKPDNNYLEADSDDTSSLGNAMIKLHTGKDLLEKLGENMADTVDIVFSKLNFLNDRKLAYSLAVDNRKNKTPSNPLDAFFIP